MLGGMSWESSVQYERIANEAVRARLGGTHAADLIVRSYDFARIEALQEADDWEAAATLLAGDAARLEAAGAELVILCTNTMHRLAPAIEAALTVPFLHIGDAVARAVVTAGVDTVGLLGTRYTMEGAFYRERLEAAGLQVVVPDLADRLRVHEVIYEELVRGEVREASRADYVAIVQRLVGQGAQGVIAGCTEIELLLRPDDVAVPLFPSAEIHALAAVDAALG